MRSFSILADRHNVARLAALFMLMVGCAAVLRAQAQDLSATVTALSNEIRPGQRFSVEFKIENVSGRALIDPLPNDIVVNMPDIVLDGDEVGDVACDGWNVSWLENSISASTATEIPVGYSCTVQFNLGLASTVNPGPFPIMLQSYSGSLDLQYISTFIEILAPAPTISAIEPFNGSAAGGEVIAIEGAGFVANATRVTFDGNPGTDVGVNAVGTSLTVTTPPGRAGEIVAVTVSVPGGGESQPEYFQYRFSPTVTLTGPTEPVPDGVEFEMTARLSGASSPTGEVHVLLSGSDQLATIGNVGADGVATLFLGGAAGTYSLYARYQGDDQHDPANSNAITVEIDDRTSGLQLAQSSETSLPGTAVEFTATVLDAVNPNGMISFAINGGPNESIPVQNGSATFIVDNLPLGTNTISAIYVLDTNGNPDSELQEIEHVVQLRASTLALASSVNPSRPGEDVTITATLADAVDPDGSVIFSIDGSDRDPVALDSSGQATLVLENLQAGEYAIGARYTGDTNGNGDAAAPPITQSVGLVATSLELVAEPENVNVGEMVSLRATVSPVPGLPAEIDFTGPGGFAQTAEMDANGVATVEVSTLPAGVNTIAASYGGDEGHAGSSSSAEVTVAREITTVSLSSSSNPSSVGEEVVFTAAVSPPTAGGSMIFTLDGADQAPVALSNGVATFPTGLLDAGQHEIVARYEGDNDHSGSVSDVLTQMVRAPGAIIVRVETDGADTSFGFTSATPELNLSVTTSGGSGQSEPVALVAGTYSVIAADMRSAGLSLSSIGCTSGQGDLRTRTATVELDAGQTVLCTFVMQDVGTHTSEMIGEFMRARAGIILANTPDTQRRIDRLNGTVVAGGSPASLLSAYLRGIETGALAATASLAQIERLAGNEQPGQFDVWASLTLGRYGNNGDFALGALGADWRFNRDLLVGAFVQADQLSQRSDANAAISGTGWLAGPYLTARLSEHLFLDLMVAGGTSNNQISPFGTYTDDFGATRFMANAALQGYFTHGALTFNPRASLSWFSETSDAYIDSLGVPIPSISTEVGRAAFGPGVSHEFELDDGTVVETGLRLEAVAEFAGNSATGDGLSLHGRIEGNIGLAFPGGARLDFSASHDGIGQDGESATAGRVQITVPLN